MYGPHSAAERIQLWKTILLSIDESRAWIFGGDWNFSELASDQVGGSPEDLLGDEAVFWNDLKIALELNDIYQPEPCLLRYTWDNHRTHTSDSDATSPRILLVASMFPRHSYIPCRKRGSKPWTCRCCLTTYQSNSHYEKQIQRHQMDLSGCARNCWRASGSKISSEKIGWPPGYLCRGNLRRTSLVRRCTRRAKNIVRNWEIREAKLRKQLRLDQEEKLVTL